MPRKPSREERFILTRGGRGMSRRASGSTSRGGDPGSGANNLLIAPGHNLLIKASPEYTLLISPH